MQFERSTKNPRYTAALTRPEGSRGFPGSAGTCMVAAATPLAVSVCMCASARGRRVIRRRAGACDPHAVVRSTGKTRERPPRLTRAGA